MGPAQKIDDADPAPIAVDWNLGFTRAPTNSGLLYWRSLLRGRAMPERKDLEPRAMARFLSFVNLVDVRAAAPGVWNYVVTLQGSHARDVLGAVQGQPLADVLPAATAQRWCGCFDLPRSNRMPVRLLTRARARDHSSLACEALVAPLGPPSGVTALFWIFSAWSDGQFAMAHADALMRAERAVAAGQRPT